MKNALLKACACGLTLLIAAAPEPPRYLFVWAGDAAHKSPDFVAVIDFDPSSPSYGKVLRTVPLTGNSQIESWLQVERFGPVIAASCTGTVRFS